MRSCEVLVYEFSRSVEARFCSSRVESGMRAYGEAVPRPLVVLEFDRPAEFGHAVMHSPHSLDWRSLILHAMQNEGWDRYPLRKIVRLESRVRLLRAECEAVEDYDKANVPVSRSGHQCVYPSTTKSKSGQTLSIYARSSAKEVKGPGYVHLYLRVRWIVTSYLPAVQ